VLNPSNLIVTLLCCVVVYHFDCHFGDAQ